MGDVGDRVGELRLAERPARPIGEAVRFVERVAGDPLHELVVGDGAAAETTWPGVQKPHCIASARTKASISGCSRSPSIVVTSLSSAAWTSVIQDNTGTPSTRTVHAPQWPSPHAILVSCEPDVLAQEGGERPPDRRIEGVRATVDA